MCVPLPSAEALDRYFSTTAANNNNRPVCCTGGGGGLQHHHRQRHSLLLRRRQRPSDLSTSTTPSSGPICARQHQLHQCRRRSCRFAPYPLLLDSEDRPSDSTPPMFKQGFPADLGIMAGGVGDQTASSVPLPPPPPVTPSTAFNLQFNQKPPTGFSGFASEHHNHYYHSQFPYTFSYASPPTYSWANTNSTDIMKFTGSSNPRPLDTSTYHVSNFGSVPVPKRKIDLDYEIPQPPKMRITEEKVSASLRDMHISNEFKSHNHCVSTDVGDMEMMEDPCSSKVISANDIAKTESKTTLVMCEELRKLNKIDSIIPQPLLNVERPNNAVVVWKPQPVMEFRNQFTNYPKEPESTVVITEITDEEEKEIMNNEDVMFVEADNTIAVEDDEMEL